MNVSLRCKWCGCHARLTLTLLEPGSVAGPKAEWQCPFCGRWHPTGIAAQVEKVRCDCWERVQR